MPAVAAAVCNRGRAVPFLRLVCSGSGRPAVRRRLLLEASRQPAMSPWPASDQQRRTDSIRVGEMPGRMPGRVHGPPAYSSHGPPGSPQAHVLPQSLTQQDTTQRPRIPLINEPAVYSQTNRPAKQSKRTTRQTGSCGGRIRSDPSWTRGVAPTALTYFPLSFFIVVPSVWPPPSRPPPPPKP